MNITNVRIPSVLEWLVLAIVVLATITLGVEEEIKSEPSLEISNLSGTIILSTRSSMDALGLDEYDRSAIATIDIHTHSVVSEGCSDCATNPTGMRMIGNVNITELIDDAGRLGRIEAELNVTYLREEVKESLIAREWLSIDWDAGDASAHSEMIIVHDPPKWDPEGRYVSAFVPKDENRQSRTGPWILIGALMDNTQNVRGCLPDSFMCSSATPDEINLTSTYRPVAEPVTIQHPSAWTTIEGVAQTNNSPTDMEDIRGMIELGEEVNETNPWCPATDEEIIATKSWRITDSSDSIISPMGIWFEALGLPSSSFAPTSGIWNEVNLQTRDCASLMDNDGNLRFGVSTLK